MNASPKNNGRTRIILTFGGPESESLLHAGSHHPKAHNQERIHLLTGPRAKIGPHQEYGTDYPAATVGLFGEWERLPKDRVELLAGDYVCDMLLTEESFHGSGLQGFWAHAMKGRIQFTIVPGAVCTQPIVGDLNNDCKVDLRDLAIFSSVWLQCNLDPPDACW